MNTPSEIRSARALYPHRPDLWEPAFLVEPPPPPPDDHPELDLFLDRGSAVRDLRPSRLDEPIPARMLNEFVYCPRLFYYEYVEGVFLHNADTERGKSLHRKVDRGRGEMPKAASSTAEQDDGTPIPPEAADDNAHPTIIHSRSATLGSNRLGVTAKMDLVEVEMDTAPGLFRAHALRVTPVDYKAGAPRTSEDSHADRMQLGLQMLILRDNGYTCDEGVIYYRQTNQRVRLPMTEELEEWILENVRLARETAESGNAPPPLRHSPKCVRCSLAPVCLPDESRLLADTGLDSAPVTTDTDRENPIGRRAQFLSAKASKAEIRRLIAARDDTRALYLNTQGLHVGKTGETLTIKEGKSTVQTVRMNDVSHVGLFGNIQLSTQALQTLCEAEIPIAYFSMGGWFYGLTRGHGLANVFTRIEQFRLARAPQTCLELARRFIHGKIRNHRTMLMRLHVEPPEAAVKKLRRAALDALEATSIGSLLGIEGSAASLYFQNFSGMIKVVPSALDDDEIPGLESPPISKAPAAEPTFDFDFRQRTRRPPKDPVNALLSLAYSLLAKDCTIASLAVGFDPYVGYYHQPRYGRPALALDLMEEFRPLIAESKVLSAINNRMITPAHFVQAGEAVNLTPAGRKVFFQAYEQRINSLITHPVFDYKVSYRRVIELQARMLARFLTGEVPEYIPMMTR